MPPPPPTLAQVHYTVKRGFYLMLPGGGGGAQRQRREAAAQPKPSSGGVVPAGSGSAPPPGFAVLHDTPRAFHLTTRELTALNARLRDASNDCLVLTEQARAPRGAAAAAGGRWGCTRASVPCCRSQGAASSPPPTQALHHPPDRLAPGARGAGCARAGCVPTRAAPPAGWAGAAGHAGMLCTLRGEGRRGRRPAVCAAHAHRGVPRASWVQQGCGRAGSVQTARPHAACPPPPPPQAGPLALVEARHPVLEALEGGCTPNDTYLSIASSLHIITG